MTQENTPELLAIHAERQPGILRRLGSFGTGASATETLSAPIQATNTVPEIYSDLPRDAEYMALSRKERSEVRREIVARHVDDQRRRQDRADAWARHRRGIPQVPADYRPGDVVVPALGRIMPILNASEFDTTSLTDEELTAAVANRFFSREDLGYEDRLRLGDTEHTPEQPKPGKYTFISKLVVQLEN